MAWDALKHCGWEAALSRTGNRMDLPQGIFYWSGRAKAEAEINATIGVAVGPGSEIGLATEDSITFHLPLCMDLISKAQSEQVFPYAPIGGIPRFRQAWKEWIVTKAQEEGERIRPHLSSPVVTAGVTAGLFVVIRLLIDEGEPVFMPDMYWDNYTNIIVTHVGGSIQTWPFFEKGKLNVAGPAQAIAQAPGKKVVMILNTPNNPTGYMPSSEEVDQLTSQILEATERSDKRVFILFDDAYEGYVYDDKGWKRSMFPRFVGLHERIVPIKLDGASKELLMYGGRIGCITVGLPPDRPKTLEAELELKLTAVVRSTFSNSPKLLQEVGADLLAQKDKMMSERARTFEVMKERWTRLNESLSRPDRPSCVVPLPCNSGFFCFAGIAGIDSDKMADHLLKKYKVGVVPSPGGLRIAFCSVSASKIPEMVDRIFRATKDF